MKGVNFEWFMRAHALAHAPRYSMRRVIKTESVAEHSYFVCLALMLLHEQYDFDLGKALAMAVAHDVPEIEISDVNHNVKREHPELAKKIKEAEYVCAYNLPESVGDAYREYEVTMKDSNEALMVKYADTLQVLQYAKSEQLLGNATMLQVEEECVERLKDIENSLRERKDLRLLRTRPGDRGDNTELPRGMLF